MSQLIQIMTPSKTNCKIYVYEQCEYNSLYPMNFAKSHERGQDHVRSLAGIRRKEAEGPADRFFQYLNEHLSALSQFETLLFFPVSKIIEAEKNLRSALFIVRCRLLTYVIQFDFLW